MKKDKQFKIKFSKEKNTFNEIDESIKLCEKLTNKIESIQRLLFAESTSLMDLGIHVCKDDVVNPLRLNSNFSNSDTKEFVKTIYDDENLFIKRIMTLQKRPSRSPSLDRRMKKAIMKSTEIDRLKKEKEREEAEKRGKNLIFQAFSKKIEQYKQREAGPNVCVKPTSLELNLHIENFKLDQNYFEPFNNHAVHQLGQRRESTLKENQVQRSETLLDQRRGPRLMKHMTMPISNSMEA